MTENIPIRTLRPTPLEPALMGNFSIRKIEDVLSGKDFNEDLHRHDFFLILCIEKGTGYHDIDFVTYDVADHSIFLIRPGQVHKLSLKASTKGYIVQFKNDYFSQNTSTKDLLRKVSHKRLCRMDAARFQKVLAVLESIFKEHTEKLEEFDEVIKSSLNIFFTELLRQRRNTEDSLSSADSYSQEKLERLFELLDAHITESKRVSFYADKLNLSAYQLSSITKSLLNKTPSGLINEHVILESKRQLLATSLQVNQIAYELGYEDVSYYIRFFKKHTGRSPESFRNNLK